MHRVGQNRISGPYMTVCMVISLLKIPYVHRIYICMYGSDQPYIYRVGQNLICTPNTTAFMVVSR
jgi:hypothetical protein